MKRVIVFLLMILIVSCTSKAIRNYPKKFQDDYQTNRAKWKGIIYEGVSVDGVMLGDSSDLVEKILGEPEFAWTNEALENNESFFLKYMSSFNEDTRLWGFQNGYITLYLTNQKRIIALSNPLFDYSYIYYNKGITLFFNECDRVVEIIVLFEIPFHKIRIKGKESWLKTEYKPYTGRLWYGNITVINATFGYLLNQYRKVMPKSEWIEPIGYDGTHESTIAVGKNCPFLEPHEHSRQMAIYFKNSNVDDPKSKVQSIVMYSPMLGLWTDTYNPWGDRHPEEAIERRKKYIKKYGHKYY